MKKRILCWALAAMLAVPATAFAAEETETESIETERKATIMVVSITGNELTYMEINTPEEEEGEPQSEEMPEPESEEMPDMEEMSEPEGGDGQQGQQGQQGGPGGVQMPDMSNMQDMIEQFQNGDVDMSGMQDMIEQFTGGGFGGQQNGNDQAEGGDGQTAEDNGQAAEDDGQSAGDDSQTADEGSQQGGNDQAAGGDGQQGQQGGPGGGQMPDMSNMQDMIEQFQNGDADMSGMQDMIEQFQNGGGFGGQQGGNDQAADGNGQTADEGSQQGGPGGGQMPDMSNMQDMIEQFTGGDVDMSGMQDMIEQFTGGGSDGSNAAGDGQEGGFSGFGGQGLTTVYLQVGVVVHADGKEKTFSILEAGDELEVLFETDEEGNEVITEMWLLDT